MDVFVYNNLLHEAGRKAIRLYPASIRFAECVGKMYIMHRFPFVLHPNDITVCRNNRRIFGAVLHFEDKLNYVIDALDNYHGCSLSRIGAANPLDLTIRTIQEVYPISFKSIHEFETYRYKKFKPIKCIMYMGNPEHEDIQKVVRSNQPNYRISDGCYYPAYKKLLIEKKYLQEV